MFKLDNGLEEITELVRRLSNIHREVVADEIGEVTEHYIGQLKNSGYTRKQAKEVIVCGVVGWRRKLERREKNGQGQYLLAEETLEKRTNDKLMEKTSWYKGRGKLRMLQASSGTILQQREGGKESRVTPRTPPSSAWTRLPPRRSRE